MLLGLTSLEISEYVILGVGAVMLLAVIAVVSYRRSWSEYLRLPEPIEHGFTPADLFACLVALLFVLPLLLQTVSRWLGGAPPPVTQAASGPAAEVLPGFSQLLIQLADYLVTSAVILGLARLRVPGGLAGWGLQTRALGGRIAGAVGIFLVCWPVCFGVLLLTQTLFGLLDPSYTPQEHMALQELRSSAVSVSQKALTAMLAVVLAPLAEEMLFRGFLQPTLARWCRDQWPAVLVSGFLFGLMHDAVPDTVPALVLFGIALGYVYARTRSLTLVILVHAVFNAKNVVSAFLAGPLTS